MKDKNHFLVFKTNIHSREDLIKLNSFLAPYYSQGSWSVDVEDVDRVLRIPNILSEERILQLIKESGFKCEVLP